MIFDGLFKRRRIAADTCILPVRQAGPRGKSHIAPAESRRAGANTLRGLATLAGNNSLKAGKRWFSAQKSSVPNCSFSAERSDVKVSGATPEAARRAIAELAGLGTEHFSVREPLVSDI